MKSIRNLVPFLPFIAGMMIAMIAFFAWQYTAGSFSVLAPSAYQKLSVVEREAHWEERIRSEGGPAAYRELAQTIRALGPSKQHTEGHIFGKALYIVKGLEGIGACDDTFAYACFHAFMVQAIMQEGDGAAQKLHDACRATLGAFSDNCDHGIGHGIQSMSTYDIAGITKALATCDSLSPASHPIAGCAGGVFMEYGTRDMGNEGADDNRPFALKEVLEPCASLASRYQGPCALWQSKWWLATAPDKSDPLKLSEDMGGWCHAMPGGNDVHTLCIEGVTRWIRQLSNNDPTLTKDICSRLTSNETERIRCHELSAKRFTFFFPLETAQKACAGLPSDKERSCRDGASAEDARLRAEDAKYDQSPGREF